MRIVRSVTTVSWIPSEMMEGIGRMATRLTVAHHDPPPPGSLGSDISSAVDELRRADRLRFANVLRAFVEIDDDGTVVDYGYLGGGVIGATSVRLGPGTITLSAVQLADRQAEPEVGPDFVRFRQTVGGRTGAPMPRPVKRVPFVQYRAPIVWTTLELTIRSDGSHTSDMTGASGFPRHWIYDDSGALVAKSSVAAYKEWIGNSFGRRTPWGDEDSPALVSQVESELEKQLQHVIMVGGRRPELVRVKRGATLVEQGAESLDVFLLLNGVMVVEVDGSLIGELGPGAVFGERASLDGGRRTATVRALTECKVARVASDRIDHDARSELAKGHRRESAGPGMSSRP